MTDTNQELTELKAKADELGIEYGKNIGAATLQKRIDEHNNEFANEPEPELKRIQIKWKNIHTGTGVKLLKGMVVEVEEPTYDALEDISKDIGGNDIDAIKLVDVKKALTHKIINVDGRDRIVSINHG